MSTATDVELDLDALEAEMPVIACEEDDHDSDKDIHDDGPATTYFRIFHTCENVDVEAICAKATAFLLANMGARVTCPVCKETATLGDWVKILGPVGS